MKKFGVVLAIFIIAIAFFGCGSTGGGQQQRPDPLVIDLTKLPLTKNARAFTRQWDDLLIQLPPEIFQVQNTRRGGNQPQFVPVDFSQYRRVTMHFKFFDRNNRPVEPRWDANALVSILYDVDVPDAQIRSGPNVPVKEMNGGMIGGDASISTDGGSVCRLSKIPAGILLQNSNADVGYIQLVLLVFHNGEFTSEE